MKKSILLLILIIIMFGVSGCNRNDALTFKKEYEKYNTNKTYKKITISKNNNIEYKNIEEINDMIDQNKTFVVYFGNAKSSWCRVVVPLLLDISKDLNINKIYYVNLEKIKDNKELNVLTKKLSSKKNKINNSIVGVVFGNVEKKFEESSKKYSDDYYQEQIKCVLKCTEISKHMCTKQC